MHIKYTQCLLAFGHINTYARKTDSATTVYTLVDNKKPNHSHRPLLGILSYFFLSISMLISIILAL